MYRNDKQSQFHLKINVIDRINSYFIKIVGIFCFYCSLRPILNCSFLKNLRQILMRYRNQRGWQTLHALRSPDGFKRFQNWLQSHLATL